MADEKHHLVMENKVSLVYRERIPANLERFADHLLEGKLIGHRCPSCSLVWVPTRGYCPMCVVVTGDRDEVAVADRGTVTGYTIVAPVRYYGQQETEEFLFASVLLDASDSPLRGQDIINIPHADVHAGLRVKAVWKPAAERVVSGMTDRGWAGVGVGGAITAFEPSGEPDADPESYAERAF